MKVICSECKKVLTHKDMYWSLTRKNKEPLITCMVCKPLKSVMKKKEGKRE